MSIQDKYRYEKEDFFLSYTKLTGKKIKDILGYVTECGDPIFNICRIVFEDDTSVSVGGEHDIAYKEDEGEVEGIIAKIYEEETGE